MATFAWVMRPSEQLSEVKFWSIVPYPSMSQCCQRGTDGNTKNTTFLFDPAGLANGVEFSLPTMLHVLMKCLLLNHSPDSLPHLLANLLLGRNSLHFLIRLAHWAKGREECMPHIQTQHEGGWPRAGRY